MGRNLRKSYKRHLGETHPAPLSAKNALGWLFRLLEDCFIPCAIPAEDGGCRRAHLFLEKENQERQSVQQNTKFGEQN